MIEAIEERNKVRLQWHERYRDTIFSSLDVGMRPMDCPVEMTEDLDNLRRRLRKWRASSSLLQAKGGGRNGDVNSEAVESSSCQQGKRKRGDEGDAGKGRKPSKKLGGGGELTKKEQKRVASNWEKLKMKSKTK